MIGWGLLPLGNLCFQGHALLGYAVLAVVLAATEDGRSFSA